VFLSSYARLQQTQQSQIEELREENELLRQKNARQAEKMRMVMKAIKRVSGDGVPRGMPEQQCPEETASESSGQKSVGICSRTSDGSHGIKWSGGEGTPAGVHSSCSQGLPVAPSSRSKLRETQSKRELGAHEHFSRAKKEGGKNAMAVHVKCPPSKGDELVMADHAEHVFKPNFKIQPQTKECVPKGAVKGGGRVQRGWLKEPRLPLADMGNAPYAERPGAAAAPVSAGLASSVRGSKDEFEQASSPSLVSRPRGTASPSHPGGAGLPFMLSRPGAHGGDEDSGSGGRDNAREEEVESEELLANAGSEQLQRIQEPLRRGLKRRPWERPRPSARPTSRPELSVHSRDRGPASTTCVSPSPSAMLSEPAAALGPRVVTGAGGRKQISPGSHCPPSPRGASKPQSSLPSPTGPIKAAHKVPQPQQHQQHRSVQVVRSRETRMALPAYACPECSGFLDAVGDLFDREQILKKCSRHRHAHKPYETPEGFWDLSFPDSQDKH